VDGNSDTAAARAVIGWLAMTVQPMLDGARVHYRLTHTPETAAAPDAAGSVAVAMSWHGEPTAATVAEQLLALSDPEFPVTATTGLHDGDDDPPAQWIRIGEIVVTLAATAPLPQIEESLPGLSTLLKRYFTPPPVTTSQWALPNPMETDGHATDTVL